MHRLIPYLLLVVLPVSAWAQKAGSPKDTIMETPFDPRAAYQTCNLKGKILPWTLGNAGGVSGFLGVEVGFLKHQSIGVDGFLYLQESSSDQVYDTTGTKHNTGNYWNSTEKAVLFDYRYYFNFPRLRAKSGLVFYMLAYVRLGNIKRHYDPLFKEPYVDQRETHRSAGLSLGTTIRAERHWGIDVNAGLFEKEKTITTSYADGRLVTQKPVGLGFRLSANVSYWFKWRKSA